MDRGFLTPAEITQGFVDTGIKKVNQPAIKLFLLGILAGAFIAFAAEGSNVATHTIESVGIAKALAGALFATGLMMVLVAGAELFTGNSLIVVSCLERRTSWLGLLRNWLFVYLGNFVGSMIVVLLILGSGQFNFSGGMLGGYTIKVATYKVGLTWESALLMGILCNWLVCLAVWMASGAKDMAGKLLAIFFPIWLFVTSGFEHSIANMFYVPAGILAKGNATWVTQAMSLGVSADKINALGWTSFINNNLVPVTLGNIIGGTLFVGAVYWVTYLQGRKPALVSRPAGAASTPGRKSELAPSQSRTGHVSKERLPASAD
ncbi:MAG TPA: formate/nitrite transporter family protein [Bacillota bacterium]|jgi:formate/nitrite transporter